MTEVFHVNSNQHPFEGSCTGFTAGCFGFDGTSFWAIQLIDTGKRRVEYRNRAGYTVPVMEPKWVRVTRDVVPNDVADAIVAAETRPTVAKATAVFADDGNIVGDED